MTSTGPVPTLSLGHASSPGLAVPQLGFGVWEVPDADIDASVGRALDVGYRHVDTAAAYRNEGGVGRVLAATDLDRHHHPSQPNRAPAGWAPAPAPPSPGLSPANCAGER